jgi:hypothetical protein
MSIFQKSSAFFFLSFRRKPESSEFKLFWTPVFTGVTAIGSLERVSIVSILMKRCIGNERRSGSLPSLSHGGTVDFYEFLGREFL